jgi:hypothetical protein
MMALLWGLFVYFHQIPPNRYLPLEVPEGPAAATSIQNISGPPQGPGRPLRAHLVRQAAILPPR